MPYCSIFKSGLTIGPRGKVRPCCAFDNNSQEEFTIFDKEWRKQHLNYSEQSLSQWLPNCKECELSESIGRPSLRQYYNGILSGEEIEYWDIKINNTCNLACRMCNIASSSGIEQMVKQNPDQPWDINYSKRVQTGWHKDVEEILPYLTTAKYIKFTGGEPFLIPQVKRIIDWLISEEICSNIKQLMFITNGNVDLTGWFERFEKFPNVQINISVDAVGKRYEYIRSGASWELLNRNLESILKLKSPNAKISVTSLPMVLNHNHIHEVEEWCKSLGISHDVATPLIYPDFMRVDALDSPKTKEKFIQQMEIQDKIWGTNYKDFI